MDKVQDFLTNTFGPKHWPACCSPRPFEIPTGEEFDGRAAYLIKQPWHTHNRCQLFLMPDVFTRIRAIWARIPEPPYFRRIQFVPVFKELFKHTKIEEDCQGWE